MNEYIGQIAAVATAFCWAITSTVFESAGKKIGSMQLNLIRLVIGFTFLSIFTLITRGQILPLDATSETWKWLLISGFIGFFIGDILLFEAFIRVGARISMLIFASVPPMSGILAYFILGETMNSKQILGMTITLIGIAIVILVKGEGSKKIKLSHSLSGILFAFGGAFGQSLGYIVGKIGLKDYNPFAATQIRIIAATFAFILLFTIKRNWNLIFLSLKEYKAMTRVVIGSFFGPFLGVSLSLLAVQHINPGVASTLMAITPIILIPVAIFIKKEKIFFKEILGAFVAVLGVSVIFLG
jgi:drug/metabolite transporter (DMT)-like permease